MDLKKREKRLIGVPLTKENSVMVVIPLNFCHLCFVGVSYVVIKLWIFLLHLADLCTGLDSWNLWVKS